MTFEQLLQLLKEHGIRLTIRRSSAEGGSHTPSIAALGAGNMTKRRVFVAEWEQIGVSSKGSTKVTREEALQLINEGATDAAGLTS
jgi:hypothetical protein